ncbi:MAG: FGGY-family carbohydrate kinase, partial [Planctomycetota bacterium]
LMATTSGLTTGVGIDLGTSGVRVCVVSSDGKIVGEAKQGWSDEEGRRPETWIRGLQETLSKCEGALSANRVCVSGTSASLLAVDSSSGEVVRAPMMYSDAVTGSSGDEAMASIEAHAPKGHVTRSRTSALAKLLTWQLTEKETPVHQADYVAAALSGGRPSTYHSDWHNALKLGYDVGKLEWPSWILDMAPSVSRLDVVEPGRPTRTVTADWGPVGAQVVAGTTDSIAAYFACCASPLGELDFEPGSAVTSLGSTTALKLVSRERIDDSARGVYSHRVGDVWLVGGASNAGCRALRAAGFDDLELAELTLGMKDVEEAPVNAGGVYPLTQKGERFPFNDPDKEPCLPDAEKLSRLQLMEQLFLGIADVERLGYQALSDLGATRLAYVKTAGGGSKNEKWRVMRERMLGVPVRQSEHTDAAFGAALLALSGCDR